MMLKFNFETRNENPSVQGVNEEIIKDICKTGIDDFKSLTFSFVGEQEEQNPQFFISHQNYEPTLSERRAEAERLVSWCKCGMVDSLSYNGFAYCPVHKIRCGDSLEHRAALRENSKFKIRDNYKEQPSLEEVVKLRKLEKLKNEEKEKKKEKLKKMSNELDDLEYSRQIEKNLEWVQAYHLACKTPLPIQDIVEETRLIPDQGDNTYVHKGSFVVVTDQEKNKKNKKLIKKRLQNNLNSLVKREGKFNEDLQELKIIYDQIVDFVDQFPSDTHKWESPSFLKKSFKGLIPNMVTSEKLLRFFSFYNLIYNIFHVNSAFGIWKCDWKLVWPVFNSSGYSVKKVLQTPFEAFLNEESINEIEYIKMKKKLKKLKKKKKEGEINRKELDRWYDLVREKKKSLFKSFRNFGLERAPTFMFNTEQLVSLMFSHYMAKKNILLTHDDPSVLFEKHRKLMTSKRQIPTDFMYALKQTMEDLFSDFHYRYYENIVLPNTSYHYRGENVFLHDFLVNGETSLQTDYNAFFRDDKITGRTREIVQDFFSRESSHKVKIIRDKGKSRVITTNHIATSLMKNVQMCVQKFLAQKNVFKYTGAQVRSQINLEKRSGDWVLSGDYSNSTDFIPQEITFFIWDFITKKIARKNLRKIVLHSLRDEILEYGEDTIIKQSGQLMGSLTSFPALCLVNYTISQMSHLNNKKINGDDLLAFCNEKERQRWLADQRIMSINAEKSHFNHKWGTFNSQLLVCKKNILKKVNHFQISKFEKSTFKDFIGHALINVNEDKRLTKLFAAKWCVNKKTIDLLDGNYYERDELNLLSDKFQFFKDHFLDLWQLGTFNGRVGGMSQHYCADDIEETVRKNWLNRYEDSEDFVINAGEILVLEDLWGGDKSEFERIFKALMRLKMEKEQKKTNNS